MLRAEIGLQTEPGATPAEVLIQACGRCHNDVLDQSIFKLGEGVGDPHQILVRGGNDYVRVKT